jgi:hypothetical protein
MKDWSSQRFNTQEEKNTEEKLTQIQKDSEGKVKEKEGNQSVLKNSTLRKNRTMKEQLQCETQRGKTRKAK